MLLLPPPPPLRLLQRLLDEFLSLHPQLLCQLSVCRQAGGAAELAAPQPRGAGAHLAVCQVGAGVGLELGSGAGKDGGGSTLQCRYGCRWRGRCGGQGVQAKMVVAVPLRCGCGCRCGERGVAGSAAHFDAGHRKMPMAACATLTLAGREVESKVSSHPTAPLQLMPHSNRSPEPANHRLIPHTPCSNSHLWHCLGAHQVGQPRQGVNQPPQPRQHSHASHIAAAGGASRAGSRGRAAKGGCGLAEEAGRRAGRETIALADKQANMCTPSCNRCR